MLISQPQQQKEIPMFETNLIKTEIQATCQKCSQVHTAILEDYISAQFVECCGERIMVHNFDREVFGVVNANRDTKMKITESVK